MLRRWCWDPSWVVGSPFSSCYSPLLLPLLLLVESCWCMETLYFLSGYSFLIWVLVFLLISRGFRNGEFFIDARTLGLAIVNKNGLSKWNQLDTSVTLFHGCTLLSSRRQGASCSTKTWVCTSTKGYFFFRGTWRTWFHSLCCGCHRVSSLFLCWVQGSGSFWSRAELLEDCKIPGDVRRWPPSRLCE